MSHWWCLKHSRVEPDEGGCANTERLGPYPGEQEAARALTTARERTAAQDAKDEAEQD